MGIAEPEKTIALADFLDWPDDDDRRHELIDGVVFDMAPPSEAHGTILGNLISLIGPSIRRLENCRAIAEAGIISVTRNDTYYQADLVVTCRPHEQGSRSVTEPLLVVEILSPSTESRDRKIKLADYRAMASVREVLYIDQERTFCEIHRRFDAERWFVELHSNMKTIVKLESIDLDMPLEEIYRNLQLNP